MPGMVGVGIPVGTGMVVGMEEGRRELGAGGVQWEEREKRRSGMGSSL